jgi:hypothetical protein
VVNFLTDTAQAGTSNIIGNYFSSLHQLLNNLKMKRINFFNNLFYLYMTIGVLGILINLFISQGYIKLVEGGIFNEGLYFTFFWCNLLCPPLLLSSASILFFNKEINYKEFIKSILICILSFYAVWDSTSYLID